MLSLILGFFNHFLDFSQPSVIHALSSVSAIAKQQTCSERILLLSFSLNLENNSPNTRQQRVKEDNQMGEILIYNRIKNL